MHVSRSAFAALAGLWMLRAACALAQGPEISDLRIGLDGHFKRGHWAEVQVTVRAGTSESDADLEVVSRDGDGVAVAFVGPRSIKIASDQAKTLTTLVKMGPPRSGLQVRLRGADEIVADLDVSDASLNGDWKSNDKTWSKAHRSTAVVIATLGPAAGTAEAIELLQRHYADEVVEVPLSGAKSLPTTWRGYDAIDCLVVMASQSDPLAEMSHSQQSALLKWLRLGGRLVLVAGDGAASIFAPESPWLPLVRGQVAGREALTTDNGLRTFAGEGVELTSPVSFWKISASPQFVALSESGAASTENPLAIDSPFGLGRVSLVLIDLAQPPLDNWKGRGRLLARFIAGESLATESLDVPRGGQMTHLGYRDLAGQLRMSLDQYAGVAPVHFYPVAGALLIYLLLLGPGAYFLLQRAAPRAMHLAWVLLPLLVIGFAGGAVALGRAAHGAAVKVNHVEIVDLDLASGTQRGNFWTSLFTPQAGLFSLTATPSSRAAQADVEDAQISWQALPGEGLGGVDAAPLASGARQPYVVRTGEGESPPSVEQLPFPLASSKMFAGSWQGTIPITTDAGQLHRGRLRDIEGTFRNVAPVTLNHAYLAYGEYIYRSLNEIKPGAVIDVTQLDRKHLEYWFTQRTTDKERTHSSPWNQEEADVPRILDIMMFHSAVRGRSYTVLSHRYQPDLDLSPLIRSGYAVLVGRADTTLMQLNVGDEPLDEANVRRWTYYRVVYPVAGAETESKP